MFVLCLYHVAVIVLLKSMLKAHYSPINTAVNTGENILADS